MGFFLLEIEVYRLSFTARNGTLKNKQNSFEISIHQRSKLKYLSFNSNPFNTDQKKIWNFIQKQKTGIIFSHYSFICDAFLFYIDHFVF